jgi:RNA-splicing ligase RtcB
MTKSDTSVANRLYTKAQAILRERYADEFEATLSALYEAEGLERRKRLTAAERAAQEAEAKRQKAAEKVKALLAEHPGLVDEIAGDFDPSDVVGTSDPAPLLVPEDAYPFDPMGPVFAEPTL